MKKTAAASPPRRGAYAPGAVFYMETTFQRAQERGGADVRTACASGLPIQRAHVATAGRQYISAADPDFEQRIAEIAVRSVVETTRNRVSSYGSDAPGPLNGGEFRTWSEYELSHGQRTAISDARAKARQDLDLPVFDVVAFSPVIHDAMGCPLPDPGASVNGQCRFTDDSRVFVRVMDAREMAHTVLHEARHLWQGKNDPDIGLRYHADPMRYEDDANAYADRALKELLTRETPYTSPW